MEASHRAKHDTTSSEGHTMHELDLHRMRTAQLRREADLERLAREAVRSRRAMRREEAARPGTSGAESHIGRPRRRLSRTA